MTAFEPAGPDVLQAIVRAVDYPDPEATAAARLRRRNAALPAGSLGSLEELGIWAAGVGAAGVGAAGVGVTATTEPFGRARLVLFAADHGIATAGVSGWPAGTTASLVRLIGEGRAPVNAVAGEVPLRVVDVGVDAEPGGEPDAEPLRIRRGSGRIDREDALSEDDTARAIGAGIAVADAEISAGADLLLATGLGAGASTVAATVVSVLTDTEPVKVVGRGGGIDDETWIRKCAAIRDARRRAWPHRQSTPELLAAAGGADLAALTGFLLRAAERRVPVLLDGLTGAAAALLAQLARPRVVRWFLAGHRSPEPAHSLALQRLGLTPVLELGLGLDQGVGALLALPVLRAAAAIPARTATWAEAGLRPPTD